MSHKWLLAALLSVGVVGCSNMHWDKHKEEDDEKDEVKVAYAQLPAPVQQTLSHEAEGAKIDSADKEMKKGKTVYEADAMIDGKNYEIKVAEDGTLLAKKLDMEENEKGDKDKKEDKD